MIDCVVIGAGPAGLSASAGLTGHGVEHVVLERGRVGETWRTQRWDSFRLNTPGWMNPALGSQDRYAYPTGGEVVERLEELAADCPVRAATPVLRIASVGDGYVLRTGDGDVRARAVVVATGDQNVPRVPGLARALPGRVAQYHAADYRNAQAMPPGAVLVVGSGQSGCQLAADLLAGGRRVLLATSAVGRLPFRYRGRSMYEWLVEWGFYDRRPRDLPDRSLTRVPNPVVAGGGRSLSLQALARSGATLVGRPVRVAGERVTFDATAGANIALADAFAGLVRQLVDGIVRQAGVDAPPAELDATDVPAADAPAAEAPVVDAPAALPPSPVLDRPVLDLPVLDLRDEDVGSVVWCTGFTGDFSWLDPALLDERGQPRHDDTAAPVPGVWYVGLRWLVRRGSSILYGFPRDASTVADEVTAYLGGRLPPRPVPVPSG